MAVTSTGFGQIKRTFRSIGGFDSRRVLRAIGQMVESQTQDHFQQEQGPEGAWTKSTRADMDPKGKTLQDTGSLKSSIHWKVLPGGVVVGTNKTYGPVHQFGFEDTVQVGAHERNGHAVRAHSRNMNIPERPFLWIGPEERSEIRVMAMAILARMAGIRA